MTLREIEDAPDAGGEGFGARLAGAVRSKRSPLCVGLDPVLDRLPAPVVDSARRRWGRSFEAAARAFLEFGRAIVDAVAPLVPAVKPQSAFYERYGHWGLWALEATIRHARRRGLLVILDAKRADIGSTSEAYADAALGWAPLPGGRQAAVLDADAVTVSPYLGEEGLRPFAARAAARGRGLFVLVRTSNPGSDEIQEAALARGGRVCDLAAGVAARLEAFMEPGPKTGPAPGYGPVGVVVGANRPQEAAAMRRLLPRSWFLLPGYGAQGAGPGDVLPFFDQHGLGALVCASRSVTYAPVADDDGGPGSGAAAGLDDRAHRRGEPAGRSGAASPAVEPPAYALAARAAVARILAELKTVTTRYSS